MTDDLQLGQNPIRQRFQGWQSSFLIFRRVIHLFFGGCGMMQWKKDLESLVEQTRAMVRHTNPTGVVPAARAEMDA